MSLEYYDKKFVTDAVEAAQKKILRELKDNQFEMQQTFNRMARAIESLTLEVKALREEQNPKLDKVKLPAPTATGG